jgi:hypothetical protein|tara:strand:- start:43 stop:495 length:453 start_codon:yes stop_codon:yes gene_type:complete
MRKCNKCSEEKPLTEFCKTGFKSDGTQKYKYQCKTCYNSNWKYRLMSTLTSRESHRVRQNGDKRKCLSRDKGINGAFLESMKQEQKGMCYWLNIPLDFTLKDKLRKPSLDRLDNSKGYEIGNVVLTTVFANTGRRDATIKEMKGFVDNYL